MAAENNTIPNKIDRLGDALHRATSAQVEATIDRQQGRFSPGAVLCIKTAHKAMHTRDDSAVETMVQEWGDLSVLLVSVMHEMNDTELELFHLADSAIEAMLH